MQKNTNKILNFALTLVLCISLIICAVKLTLSLRPLYYFDIDHLKIGDIVTLNKTQIEQNYNNIIDYINDSKVTKLILPDFKMSEEGTVHFKEVKNIFTSMNYLLFISLVIGVILFYLLYRKKSWQFLKYSSVSLIALPVLLFIPFSINFDKSFTIFHKIFFRNGYWEFNPETDPVIYILPQEFFFHCALVMLLFIVFFSLVCWILYKRITKKNSKGEGLLN